MAAYAADYKYARAYDGSSAYDLGYVEAAPRRAKTVEIPVRKQREEVKTAVRPRTAVKAQTASSPLLTITAVIMAAAAIVMLVFMILSYTGCTAIAHSNEQLAQRLSELTDEESKLYVEYENTFNINEIEQYALGTLGMVAPGAGQTGTIETYASDRSEVINDRTVKTQREESMVSFMASLAEYF